MTTNHKKETTTFETFGIPLGQLICTEGVLNTTIPKFFNTAGPCNPADHYMIDPIARAADFDTLLAQKAYFVVHAPRQSGKTTLLEVLAKKLTLEGKYCALRVSCEMGQPFGDNFGGAELTLLERIKLGAQNDLPNGLWPAQPWPTAPEGSRIYAGLSAWAKSCPLPLVLLFDEIDALVDKTLESVLRQLRDGFSHRPAAFPHSIVLCGLRDVRDYKVASGSSPRLGTASPFNVKVESLRIGSFDVEEVKALYLQHTAETGQIFAPEALALAFELTGGQPWLVNALARELVEKIKVPICETIMCDHFEEAAQRLILARATHLDSLSAKLNEDRVRRVLAPILAGSTFLGDSTYNDDVLYVRDLGLIAPKDPIRVANPIYKEVIIRVLAERATPSMVFERPSFKDPNGTLNVDAILSEFAMWWRENAEVMLHGHVYHEVAAQIVFMAWLQRVVNGGGIIDREYGVGRGRIDLLIRWPLPGATNSSQWQKEAFELKVWLPGKPDPLAQGLEQLERYLDGLGLTKGTLVVFDRRPEAKNSAERTLLLETKTPKGYSVRLLRA